MILPQSFTSPELRVTLELVVFVILERDADGTPRLLRRLRDDETLDMSANPDIVMMYGVDAELKPHGT